MAGIAHKYGDHVDTDVIIPGRYCHLLDPRTLAEHCLEDLDAGFAGRVREGDLLVGGENFGCGSSRELAPLAIKYCGIACVIAKSFARIFTRNAINIGLPIAVCPECVDELSDGDCLEVRWKDGSILNLSLEREYRIPRFSGVVETIVAHGGLVGFVRARLTEGAGGNVESRLGGTPPLHRNHRETR